MRILVVDDESMQRETLRRGLRREGFEVFEAESALHALAWLGSEEGRAVDLLLTDFSMPGMNGLELVKQVRLRLPLVPVIMMTAYGEKELVIDAMREGCRLFLEKPFTLDRLRAEIDHAREEFARLRALDRVGRDIPLLAHQINNPLAAIMGTAELALLELDDREKLKGQLDRILVASQKIREINRQVMGTAPTDAANRAAAPRPTGAFDPREALDACLSLFEELLCLKGIRVERDYEPGSLTVRGVATAWNRSSGTCSSTPSRPWRGRSDDCWPSRSGAAGRRDR